MSESPPSRGQVLVVLHEEVLGGATMAVLRCLPGLVERGWSFSFWAPPGPAADELRSRGEQVDGLARPIAYSVEALRLAPGVLSRARATPTYLAALRRRLRRNPPDIVHANSHVTLADAGVAHAARRATVIHIHEMFGNGIKWDLGRRLVRRWGTEVVAVSDACADALEVGGWRPHVVRNGIELPPPRSPRSPGRPFTVGTVAAIARRKGIDVLVDAVRLVHERDPSIRFELVGAATDPLDANWANGVLAEARRLGVDHRERADVPAALARWDAFALPSRRDPFPLSVLEAMGAELPVVASAVDGIREQVDATSGTLVAPESPSALADAILALAGRPEPERAAIGAAARERVGRMFTLPAQVEALDRIYARALARRSRKAGAP